MAHDADAVLSLYAEDAVHEFVGFPDPRARGIISVRRRYELMYGSISRETHWVDAAEMALQLLTPPKST